MKRAEQQFEGKLIQDRNYSKIAQEKLRQHYQLRLVQTDVILALLSSISMGLCLKESQLYNESLNLVEPSILSLRIVALILGVISSCILVKRQSILAVTKYYQSQALSKSLIPQDYLYLSLDILIALICPIPDFDFSFTINSSSFYYDLDKILSALALFKCIFILRLIPHMTEIRSDISRIIFDHHGVKVNAGLYVKIQIKERPFTVLGSVLVLATVIFGFGVQLFERGLQTPSTKGRDPGNYDFFSDISNSMWCVILGMTTVGYGDITPVTQIGRLYVVAGCFSGSFILMLITISVEGVINHDERETKVYDFIKNLKKKHAVMCSAALVIQNFYRYNRNTTAISNPVVTTSITVKTKPNQIISAKIKLLQSIDSLKEQIAFSTVYDQEENQRYLLLAIGKTWDVKFQQVKSKLEQHNQQPSQSVQKQVPLQEYDHHHHHLEKSTTILLQAFELFQQTKKVSPLLLEDKGNEEMHQEVATNDDDSGGGIETSNANHSKEAEQKQTVILDQKLTNKERKKTRKTQRNRQNKQFDLTLAKSEEISPVQPDPLILLQVTHGLEGVKEETEPAAKQVIVDAPLKVKRKRKAVLKQQEGEGKDQDIVPIPPVGVESMKVLDVYQHQDIIKLLNIKKIRDPQSKEKSESLSQLQAPPPQNQQKQKSGTQDNYPSLWLHQHTSQQSTRLNSQAQDAFKTLWQHDTRSRNQLLKVESSLSKSDKSINQLNRVDIKSRAAVVQPQFQYRVTPTQQDPMLKLQQIQIEEVSDNKVKQGPFSLYRMRQQLERSKVYAEYKSLQYKRLISETTTKDGVKELQNHRRGEMQTFIESLYGIQRK